MPPKHPKPPHRHSKDPAHPHAHDHDHDHDHAREGHREPRRRRPHRALDAVWAATDRQALHELMAPFVPDEHDRTFVFRCMFDEGPHHHRGSNAVLMGLLALLAQQRSTQPLPPPDGPGEHVPMRLPPHQVRGNATAHYPLALPTEALRALSGGDPQAVSAMVDMLTDGPPQHALANVAMVAVLDALWRSGKEKP